MKKFNLKNLITVCLIIIFATSFKASSVYAVNIPISSCTELSEMSDLSGSFYLTQDIDCSATSGWNGGSGWLPLGTFTGSLDGRGFSINDLYINRGATDNVGLFSIINGGHVFDLSFARADITGKNYVGALAGKAGTNATTIEDITVGGDISGELYVGGVIGMTQETTISGIQASGAISADGYAGGLSGFILNSNMEDVNSSATVTVTTDSYVGGLTAQADDSTFDDVHATGAVTGVSFVGGLVGLSPRSTYINCSASGNVVGVYNQGNTGGLIASTSGTGTVNNCYASGNVSGGIVAGGLIGTQATGLTISNSYATGVVSNSKNGVGGLVGVSNDEITKSYATGNVTGQGDGVGGLVGESYSLVSESWSSGSVTGGGSNVGGLVGYNSNTSTIIKSYSTGAGNVLGTGDGVGGLVGTNYGTIEKSYSNKNATGNDQVGGLSGNNFGATILNCYATGNVGISNAANKGGGLVGTTGGCTISNSYSIGSKIASAGTFYGFIGNGLGGETVNNSYWDVTTSGVGSSGDSNVGGIGKTTAEMKTLATYDTWNISSGSDYSTPTIWYMGSSYPELHYTPGATTSAATSIALASATLNGTLNYYYGVNGYFQYRKVGASSWTSTSPQVLATLGAFSKGITGLTSNTNYEYRTVIDYGTGYNYGSIVSFQTLKQDPQPTTQDASNILPLSAKLKGEVTDLGDYITTDVSFRYRKTGDSDWTTTPAEEFIVAGEVEAVVTGLSVGTNYEYQLKVVFGSDQEVFGLLSTFKTLYGSTSTISYSSNAPTTTTTTKPAENVLIQNSLSETEYNNSSYYIQYRKQGDTQWNTTNKKPMPQKGEIEEILQNIQGNTTYEYQYVIETQGNQKIYGQIAEFFGSSNSFPLKSFVLVVYSNDEKKGSVSGGGIFYNNQSVTIKAKENTGYKFIGWEEKGVLIGQENNLTFSINGSRNIKAIFVEDTKDNIVMSLQLQLIELLKQLLLMLQNR